MTDPLTALLDARDWLMLDGATGTNLFAMGLMSGEAPELWNVDDPDKIRALHDGFIEAGSDIILTNSFGGTRHRLKLHEAQGRVGELNAAAARLARERADAAGRPVIVAGSVGPTGEILQPVGALGHADAQISRIDCPIGVPSLGKHPQAIAVGVAWRLLDERRREDAAHAARARCG